MKMNVAAKEPFNEVAPFSVPRWLWAVCIALAVMIASRIVGNLVFLDEAISDDEWNAVLGAELLRRGMLVVPVAPEWRDYAGALTPNHVASGPGWIHYGSGYLPGNSAIRALADSIGAAAWASPALAAIAVLATFGTARCLYAGMKAPPLAAAALLATMPAVLINAGTPFAMTAHLAVNAVWLWLFVINRPASHAAAISLGLVGTGLHQFVFHPLFVAPFIALLFLEKRWRLFAAYALSYCVIIIAWAQFRGLALGTASSETGVINQVMNWFTLALAGRFGHHDLLIVIPSNLLLFLKGIGILAPFTLVLGFRQAWATNPVMKAAMLGVVFTFVFMQLVLPSSGISWGYRYMHGQLGILALVGAATFQRTALPRKHVWLVACAGTLILFVQMATAARQTASSFFSVLADLRASTTDFVVFEGLDMSIGQDAMAFSLARNAPDFSNRPLLINSVFLSDEQIAGICRRGTVRFVRAQDLQKLGFSTPPEPARTGFAFACPAADGTEGSGSRD